MSDNVLLSKLEGVFIRFKEVSQLITDPEVMGDMKRFVKLSKEYKELDWLILLQENIEMHLRLLPNQKKY